MRLGTLVVVTGVSRSGTSIIAGLLHHHGIWGGTYRETDYRNPKGFYENRKINLLLRRRMQHARFYRRVCNVIRKEGYKKGQWFVKSAINFGWKKWLQFNPKWILVRRDWQDVLQSQGLALDKPMSYRKFVLLNTEMNFIRKYYDGVDVVSDELVEGNYDVMSGFFDRVLRIRFDSSIADKFIDKELWHGGQS